MEQMMSNLQPLKWSQKNLNPLAELELTAYSALHEYEVTEPKQGKFELKKTRLSRPDKKSEFLPYFDTAKEAQDWAWSHYQRSMQPYVKPSRTWISVDDRLPEKNTTVLVVYHAHFDDEEITEFDVCTAFFDGETFDPKDQLFYMKRNTTVVHWMPIPEFSKVAK
jgi:hypothetical protein